MGNINYIGEHLLPGQIGHFLNLLGFVAVILSTFAYFNATRNEGNQTEKGWKKIGKNAFRIHALSIFGLIGIIFYIMIQKYYEYNYAFQHVSDDLPFEYIFSAFWEGQEGSFLLWIFWHCVLGLVFMWKEKEWEAPVMTVISSVQIFITSMILGVYFGETKVGSSPVVLFRDTADMPLFNSPDYVSKLAGFADGLNPLLQNYWMTIHPPTLFLGFASTIVPFAFAIAALWTGRHKKWLTDVLPWALFSAAILGVGILMGGAWAYEALNFGGYWAWDPVENMSLVPWLILLAGMHANVIGKSTGYSIKTSYIFYMLSFLLIVYSTFLTRSGVLGETSVHAFTEMGLETQLIGFMAFFALLSTYLFFFPKGKIPSHKKEEAFASREFWMFIGTLVFLFSSILITYTTSIPVYNKIGELFGMNPNLSAPTDVVGHYNRYQLWIGVFLGLISGATMFLRYREKHFDRRRNLYWKHIGISVLIAGILTFFTGQWMASHAFQFWLLLFSGYFAIITNLDYFIFFLKGKWKLAGSSFSHIGFGVMLLGIIASGLNKRHISHNEFAQRGLLDEESLKKNVLLLKNQEVLIDGYFVNYTSDTLIERNHSRFYTVEFKKIDKDGNTIDTFAVTPNALYNNRMTKIAALNPSTKHMLTRDIFSHVASLPASVSDVEAAAQKEKELNYSSHITYIDQLIELRDTLPDGDTTYVKSLDVVLKKINYQPTHPDYIPEEGDVAIGGEVHIYDPKEDTTYIAHPMIAVRNGLVYQHPIQVNEIASKIKISEESLADFFGPFDNYKYSQFTVKQGEVFHYNGLTLMIKALAQEPKSPGYIPEPNDVAIGADLQVLDSAGKEYSTMPVFCIRNKRQVDFKNHIPELNLQFRFLKVDPNTGELTIGITDVSKEKIPVLLNVATNSFRTDFIVLETIVFPGINLFWLGSIMMMVGLFISMFFRRKQAILAEDNED